MKKIEKYKTKKELQEMFEISSNGLVHPIIYAKIGDKSILLKNGDLLENNLCIELGFDDFVEFNEFIRYYSVTGFKYEMGEFIRLNKILPKISNNDYIRIIGEKDNFTNYLLDLLK